MTQVTEANALACEIPHRSPEEKRIVDQIYKAVLEHRLAPKTKLAETRLCESFGVGRMHVRRALLILASQGIVELRSNRGAYVACPNPDDARRTFEARILIEPAMASKAADHCREADIASLRRHIELEDGARKNADRADVIRLSGEFHVKLVAATGYADLTRFVRELVIKTSLIVGLFGGDNDAHCPEDEHAEILSAIEAGDAGGAAKLVSHHLRHIQSGLDFSGPPDMPTDLSRALGLA